MSKSKEVDKKLREKALTLLDAIAEGKDESEACKLVGIRRGTLVKWIIQYPEFEQALNNAKRMRADTYKTSVSEMVYDQDGNVRHYEKDEIPSVKNSFEMLKWLASVDNPDKYGQRIKHEGNVGAPTQIIIDTGIKQIEKVNEQPAIETSSEELL